MGSSRLKSRRRQDQGSKWSRVSIAILSTVGVIDTGSITINKWGWIENLNCPGGLSGCDKVLNSPWGTFFETNKFSIPLSLIGLISYLLILLMAIIPLIPTLNKQKINLSKLTWWGSFYISISIFVFSLILISIMIFKIKALCFFCILSCLISFLILLLNLIGGSWEDNGKLFFRGFIVSVAILLTGLVWSSSVDRLTKDISSNIHGMPPEVISISSPEKIKLAEHLTQEGVRMYNAYWCPHCHDQKEMFGKEAAAKLNLIECAKDGFQNKRELCEAKDITGFPSWEFNGSIESGVKSLRELAEITNYKNIKDFNK
tara:strand:+ start:125 stop:1072 length:948 start_codon:yes stop_codon:yes gene_type:complete